MHGVAVLVGVGVGVTRHVLHDGPGSAPELQLEPLQCPALITTVSFLWPTLPAKVYE